MARLTILGCGTALPDSDRHSAAHHLEVPGASILLDCGPGTLHGLAKHAIDWIALTHVAVSHYHNDHVGDLAALLFAMRLSDDPRRAEALTLVGPLGFGAFLDRLLHAFGGDVRSLGFEVIVEEVVPERPFEGPGGGFRLECQGTPHTAESLAYRVHGPWGSLGYTGDTGPADDVAHFLAACQVLVAECALKDPPTLQGHLSPTLVAELADIARPQLLALTHVYPPLTPDDAVARVREHYDGHVVPAADGMVIEFGPKGPAVDLNPKAV